MRVLVVEDDHEVNELLCNLLHQNEYLAIPAYSGLEALQILDKERIGLVLLDLMLPSLSGEQLLSTIRTSKDVPVIIISAKSSLSDKVELLKSGADDYITKPFHTEEVLARIESCLRRTSKQYQKPSTVSIYALSIDTHSKSAKVNGKLLQLTSTEYKLLEALAVNPHKTFSKRQLFEIGWKEKYLYSNDVINTHISNLRKKLKALDNKNDYIDTVFGIGYKLHNEKEK